MNTLYNDLVTGQKVTKKAKKESKVQVLELCPDTELTVSEMAQLKAENEALKARITGNPSNPAVVISTPIVKQTAFKEPKVKKPTTLKKKEIDTGQSSKQHYALRCCLARLIKADKIDGTKIETSAGGFPTCKEWLNLSYNQMFDELAKYNAIK